MPTSETRAFPLGSVEPAAPRQHVSILAEAWPATEYGLPECAELDTPAIVRRKLAAARRDLERRLGVAMTIIVDACLAEGVDVEVANIIAIRATSLMAGKEIVK